MAGRFVLATERSASVIARSEMKPYLALIFVVRKGVCKPYGRLNLTIGDDDELGSFIFRTMGYNSIESSPLRLNYYRAVSGNLLSCMPLEYALRASSTTQSHRSAIYYADITVKEGMTLSEDDEKPELPMSNESALAMTKRRSMRPLGQVLQMGRSKKVRTQMTLCGRCSRGNGTEGNAGNEV